MLNVTFHIVRWDYRQHPDWHEVQRAISCYNRPVITEILDTGDDHDAILICSMTATREETREAYARWSAQREG